MRIGGFQKFSLIDYPGKIASVIFTQGCNLRCRYCHNAELIPADAQNTILESWVLEFLQKRQEYIGGVVITGGEPTQQLDLIEFLDKLKRRGFLVKLDTNGTHPSVLRKVIDLRLVNYIAMDVKAPFHKYEDIVGVNFPVERIKESIDIILESEIQHSFRTTVVKSLCPEEDLQMIKGLLIGAQRYSLQNFQESDKVLDRSLLQRSQYTDEEIMNLKESWEIQGLSLV